MSTLTSKKRMEHHQGPAVLPGDQQAPAAVEEEPTTGVGEGARLLEEIDRLLVLAMGRMGEPARTHLAAAREHVARARR